MERRSLSLTCSFYGLNVKKIKIKIIIIIIIIIIINIFKEEAPVT